MDCESNGSILIGVSSCKLGKSWSVQPQVNGIPSNIRLAMFLQGKMFVVHRIQHGLTRSSNRHLLPMVIAYGMGLAPVMIRLLLQICSSTPDGTQSVNCTLLSINFIVRDTDCGGSGDCKIK